MEDGKYVDGSIWFYAPNKGAPVFFAVAFASSGLWHLWQTIHYKSWKLTGLYVFCASLFAAGFVTREIGAFHYDDLVIYIVSVCLTYAAPPIFELCNYNVLGRILYYVPYHSPIHPGRVVTTFGAISFVVEALNGTGASYVANQSLTFRQQAIGRALLKASLLLQIFVVASFVLLAALFQRRCRRAGLRNARLHGALRTLYASTALLAVRTIYRIVEYWSIAQLHFDGSVDPQSLSPLVRYEWFFYVFEAAVMLANQVLLNLRHPRRYLPVDTKTYLARDGETELVGPGLVDKRPFLITVVDPFDIRGLIKGSDKKNRFWENDGIEPSASQKRPRARKNREDPEA